MDSSQIVNAIRLANLSRSHENISRRLLKILEELGETSEAYLSRTSPANYKHKTWEDYREEGIDTLIVMVDVALTSLPYTNWPPSTHLCLHVEDGYRCAAKTFPDLEKTKFDIARAVCAAEECLRISDAMGFYGAMSRGVKSAASLCYADIPGAKNTEIDKEVFEMLNMKLQKWMRSQSTSATTAPQALSDEDSLKSFMEERFDN